ncbi:MAG: hypothetical protein V7L11_29435 [Nostoc sp.]|uniref:hypothetical protein n=1 Tax=Nostoc sp. TaxID=1180 RepID=UPI002FF6825A
MGKLFGDSDHYPSFVRTASRTEENSSQSPVPEQESWRDMLKKSGAIAQHFLLSDERSV